MNTQGNAYLKRENIVFFLITLAIIGVSMLVSFEPILANIPINILFPLYIMFSYKLVKFEKIKLATLIFFRAVVILAVFNILDRNIYVKLALILLVINILEATLADFKRKKYFNVISGILLALSIYFFTGRWIDLTNILPLAHIYEVYTPNIIGTIAWILAYTIWNWIFVSNEFSASITKLHIGILIAPIISCIITLNPGFWLVFRANSLIFGGCIQITQKSALEKYFENDKFTKFVEYTKTNKVQIACLIINIILITLSIVLK